MPAISVLMAHHGGTELLARALTSLGAQTFRDFELVLVDDGTDVEWDRLLPLARCTAVELINNGQNLGLTRSLNIGLGVCRGDLIARVDSDDVICPQRFRAQVGFLERQDHVSILGSAVTKIDSRGRRIGRTYPLTEPADIALTLPIYNQICHGSVMMRADALRSLGGYDESYQCAQDYALWLRARAEGLHFGNLDRPLTFLRIHGASVSARRAAEQRDTVRSLQSHFNKGMIEPLERFFAEGRDRPQRRPYESLQLGKLALLVYLATRGANAGSSISRQATLFLARNLHRTLNVLLRERALSSQAGLKIELGLAAFSRNFQRA